MMVLCLCVFFFFVKQKTAYELRISDASSDVCSSVLETRYYRNGIFLHVSEDDLKAAATDGHRLARFTIKRPDGAEGMPDVIVPRKCEIGSASCGERVCQ